MPRPSEQAVRDGRAAEVAALASSERCVWCDQEFRADDRVYPLGGALLHAGDGRTRPDCVGEFDVFTSGH